MAHFKKDRVRDTTTTIGTNPLVLLGVVPTGYQGFSTMAIGDTCFYSCVHQSANEWETGLATMSSAATLTRTTVLESSNANAAVNFSVGTKDVWVDLPAKKRAVFDQEGVTLIAGTTAIAPLTMVSGANLTTAVAGSAEYNGIAPMFTPIGTQRGVIPAEQYYRLNATLVGANAVGNQHIIGKGCAVSSSTIYGFEGVFALNKAAGTTSHTVSFGFAGSSSTFNNILYNLTAHAAGAALIVGGAVITHGVITSTAQTVITTAITTAAFNVYIVIKGTVSINTGVSANGFVPAYSLSAAPGGVYATQIGSYFRIYPIAAAGADINVGVWA